MTKRCEIVAEIGCNHMGELNVAIEMVRTAVLDAGVNLIKFQKRNVKALLTQEQFNAPHPNPKNSFGETYGKHREYLEFDAKQHDLLRSVCLEVGATYTTSVWDIESFNAVAPLLSTQVKIPSACNTNAKLLGHICQNFPGKIHVSLGMTTREEEDQLFQILSAHDRNQDLVLYACTSGYPTLPEDTCLLEISRLIDTYGSSIAGVGYSGHHLETSIDIAAVALGAQFIERHFTLDRTSKGTDHQISLLPSELARLKKEIETVSSALHLKHVPVLPTEIEHRRKLKWV